MTMVKVVPLRCIRYYLAMLVFLFLLRLMLLFRYIIKQNRKIMIYHLFLNSVLIGQNQLE